MPIVLRLASQRPRSAPTAREPANLTKGRDDSVGLLLQALPLPAPQRGRGQRKLRLCVALDRLASF